MRHLVRRAKRSAGWALSAMLHAGLLLLALLLVPSLRPTPVEDPVTITAAVKPASEQIFDHRRKSAHLERSWSPPVSELPSFRHLRGEPWDIPHNESEESEPEMPQGIPAAALRLSSPRRGSNLGIGANAPGSSSGREEGTRSGSRGARGSRPRARPTGGDGGSPTENAIEAALKWLAAHQKKDGSWSLSPSWERTGWKFPEHRARRSKPSGSCGDAVGTGLALLAFSGAGHGESGSRYSGVIRKGLDWLCRWQRLRGMSLGEPHTAAITAMALCEGASRSNRGKTRKSAQSALDSLGRHYLGEDRRRRFLISEAIWAAFAFKVGERTGLKIKTGARKRLSMILFVGRTGHGNFVYKVVEKNSELKPEGKGFGCATAGGTAALLCLGHSSRNDRVARSAALTLAGAVKANRCFGTGDFLPAHHGAVAAALMDGEYRAAWRKISIAPTLARQIRTGPDQGAWPTKMTGYLWTGDKPNKGNVFATALGALILESTLRHSPLYR